ncbi:hypothetical protein F0562_010226 [Nyssa sinensis]|uniref:Apple domain-containing protein n=1 Tax=Nyssa sinensis TaxID=561372 RepID=A0A5J4ZY96_9ASTE|nr:hypothetical protein F0562_010226 [Nyssa sinensis]
MLSSDLLELTPLLQINPSPMLVLLKGSEKKYRTGLWNGLVFSGAIVRSSLVYTPTFVSNTDELYFMWSSEWTIMSSTPSDQCEDYGRYGANGICKINEGRISYANSDIRGRGSGCLIWFGDLIDIREIISGDSKQDIYIRMPASELRQETDKDEIELPFFDMVTIATATKNFSCTNMIGEGGFGPVYKVK